MTTMGRLGIDLMRTVERLTSPQEIIESVAVERQPPPLPEEKRMIYKRLEDCIVNPDGESDWNEIEAAALRAL